ncbi:MAG: PP2C family serine/threonine-protein phosphatase [Oscillospiraceae bacterium]
MFKGLNVTVMGRSHEENGTVCQDSSDFDTYNNYSICVVADGHGSKKHFRSDVGSKLAVQSSMETVAEFMNDYKSFSKAFRATPSRIISRMQKNIISKWNDKILEHYNENPITDKEMALFTGNEFNSIKMESYYGTTLIIGVLCQDFSFGLQIGDGSLVMINEMGEIEMPITDDESHPANITASMCNSNAYELFNSYYRFDNPIALMVSTDGLYTSFASRHGFEEYNLIALSLVSDMQNAQSSIKSNLEKRTKYGSRDDISLSIVFDEERRALKEKLIQNSLDHMKKVSKIEVARQMALKKKIMSKNALNDEADEEF